jgi:hypothetical protein
MKKIKNIIGDFMEFVKGFKWKEGMNVEEMVEQFSCLGFQAINLFKAGEIILKMKRENAKIILAFTSNLGGTSGLRDFIAQLVELKIPSALVTTVGAIEEDIMKAIGEKFLIKGRSPDSLDIFRYKVFLREKPKIGDKIVFKNVGAYNFYTDFNNLPRIKTVIMDDFPEEYKVEERTKGS